MILFFFVGCVSVMQLIPVSPFSENEVFVVNTYKIHLRKGSGTSSQSIGYLYEGDMVIYENKEGDWIKVNFYGEIGYVYYKYLTPISGISSDEFRGWKKIELNTGEISECFATLVPLRVTIDDFLIENYLKISGDDSTDTIVKLTNRLKTIPLFVAYIKNGDSYTFRNIPEGMYYLDIVYGNELIKKYEGNNCEIKFMKNIILDEGREVYDFNKHPERTKEIVGIYYNEYNFPSYEVFLSLMKSKKR